MFHGHKLVTLFPCSGKRSIQTRFEFFVQHKAPPSITTHGVPESIKLSPWYKVTDVHSHEHGPLPGLLLFQQLLQ